MTDRELRVAGEQVEGASGWSIRWLDPAQGIVHASDGRGSAILAVVEGAGTDWHVTLRGRRLPVSVRTWRERVLAEAESAAGEHRGPIDVKATLPGLVVAVSVAAGAAVAAGDPLLTIEAMKMQNEVRAPRDGRVVAVAVAAGQAVATGALLLRLE
jgi:acetyl/propionyl-CoA carboxylase alpha subunit